MRMAGVGMAAAAVAAAIPNAAHAATGAAFGVRPSTTVTDLGPGIVAYSLMSGIRLGDTMYIGSRNLAPTRVAAYHLPTRSVTASTTLGPGKFVQGMAVDRTGRYLYAGIVYDGDKDQPNLFRWDLSTPEVSAVPVARIPDLDVRRVTVAPDGIVYAVGMEADPGIWEVDPETGSITNIGIPDPNATQSRAVAATATTVYFGAGSNLSGGDGASRASLFAVDRVTRTMTSVLPPEMAEDSAIRDVEIIGDRLYVGTEGSADNGKFGYVELADPSSYRVFASSGKSVKLFREQNGTICFSAGVACGFSVAEERVFELRTDGVEVGEIWGIDWFGDKVVVVSGSGYVAEIDPASGGVVKTDLAEAGAPADPQLGMSVSVGGGYAYVGGNGSLARHTLSDGSAVNLEFPGEAKDGVVVGTTLFTGQYSSQGIWRYDPTTGEQPHQAIALPQEQNRPQDVFWDDVNGVVLAGVQCDTKGGGSLAVYSPSGDHVDLYVNPLDEYQMVRAVTSGDGIAYLGGENIYKTGPGGVIAAWDVVAGREIWRIDPGQSQGVSNLVVRGRHLYCICRRGELIVIDLPTRRIIHRSDLTSTRVPGHATLVVSRGRVYGVSATSLFVFDPKTFEVTDVIVDLDAQWYGMPRLATDEVGDLYTLRGRNLIRVVDKR